MSKRGSSGLAGLLSKKAKTDEQSVNNSSNARSKNTNRYLSSPVVPERALSMFLTQARNSARKMLPKESTKYPVTKPFCEVEARLGILKLPFGTDRRVTSSGPKHVNGNLVRTFFCNQEPACRMKSGVTRSHFSKWTMAGLSELSPISHGLGVTNAANIKRDIVENEYVETVYAGYPEERRVCYPGLHPPPRGNGSMLGKMEHKDKLANMDLTIPAANYDLRISLATEKVLDPTVPEKPPSGWNIKRIKRRRSYTRRDKSIAWQIDVTEVTTSYIDTTKSSEVDYEIEVELRENVMLQIVNENDDSRLQKMTSSLAQQLWWMISQLNPLAEIIDVEDTLRDHPDQKAVQLALAQCGAFRKFMQEGCTSYDSPIQRPQNPPPAALSNCKFVGCMPVNFSRHDIDEVQRSPENGYFLSEKTDGVRHFMVFTGGAVVLVDRAMRGKQPKPVAGGDSEEPMRNAIKLIKPGTVFDGEVVMYRGRGNKKARPLFIIFDVLSNSATEPILHLPFEKRLRHLHQASFREPSARGDIFPNAAVADLTIALPLVRKNFVKRTEIDELFSNVVEERGVRTYRKGEVHNHMTDGIIFQPNRPYICGTDVNLLKWKYLDTVTIDIEILPLRHNDDDDVLRVGCLGDEGTMVDMTRHVKLPVSERLRLEADRHETGARIAEVGFDSETGEWYYLTMRPDKVAPNHISTVLGTVLELSESLTTEELRYRMSVPVGTRDTYRKDLRGMLKQLLDFQRK